MKFNSPYKATYCLIALSLILSACGKTNIQPETVAPISVAMPAFPLTPQRVGDKRVTKDLSGEVVTFENVSIENNQTTVVTDDGHEWINLENMFLPSPSFSGPDFGTGTQTISSISGDLYPLAVGNKMSFVVKGKSTKWPDGWKNKRSCEVEAQEQVTVPAGQYDAFRVVCTEQKRKRVMYFSPEINTIIWYKNVHLTDPSGTRGWEMIEFISG